MFKKIDANSFRQMCGGGRCPKVLLNDHGDALVQGLDVEQEVKTFLNVPEGENVLFLPNEVVKEFINNVK